MGETPRLADGAIEALMVYGWPGNVRELENIIERAMILYRGQPLRFDGLQQTVGQQGAGAAVAGDGIPLELDAMNVQHIKRVLEMTAGKIHGPGGAAEILGINPSTLRTKMKKLGIAFKKC